MQELQSIFKGRVVPKTLVDLYCFSGNCEEEYAEGFGIIPEYDLCDHLYADDTVFSSRIIEFAHGDVDSVSSYALWVPDGVTDCEDMPVVFLDSGSGVNLISSNLKEFLVVLSYDVACDGDFYYKDCDAYDSSPCHDLYVKWLIDEMGLNPVSGCVENKDKGYHEVKEITERAKERFGDELNRWLHGIEAEDTDSVQGENIDTRGIEVPGFSVDSLDDLIDLLYLSMEDHKVLGALDALGLGRPVLDGNYLKEEEIYISDEDESVFVRFADQESREKTSLRRPPSLVTISVSKNATLKLPFGITFADSYRDIVKKIGKEAEYQHCISDEMKIWILETPLKHEKYEFEVWFDDEDALDGMLSLGISKENVENRVENEVKNN